MRTHRDRLVTWTSLALFTAAAGLAVAQPGNKPQPSGREGRTTRTADQPRTQDQPRNRAQGQDRPQNRADAAPTGDIFYLYSAGMHGCLTSPKDQGLRDALALLQPRLVELARIGQAQSGNMGGPDPEQVIETLWPLINSPLTLRLAATEPGDEGGAEGVPPIAFEMRSQPDNAEQMHRTLVAMMREGDGPVLRSAAGGHEFDTPIGLGRLAVEDDAFTLSVGEQLPEADYDWGLPDGFTTVFAFHGDLRAAQPLIEMALASADEPGMEQVRPMLEQSGVLGENAVVFDVAVGHSDQEAVMRGTVHGVRAHAAAMGIPEDVSLDSDFLSVIPADATFVSAGVFDLGFMDQLWDVPEFQEGVGQADDALGIDIKGDIIDQIGNRFALYQSDATGGGGVTSTIAVLELNDGAAFGRAHRRLVDAANDALREQVAQATQGIGGVEVRARLADGVEFFTLTFPGLPIPLEVSWTIHGDHLMAALSPRSLVEAMAAAGDGPSFADNDMLGEMAGDHELLSVNYTDSPRFARQGYWVVSTLLSGLSNAVRNTDGEDPGIPLPPYNDFIEGIRPNMAVTYWDGDDMKMSGRSDASMLVNLAGSSGAILGPLAIGAAAGALIPAMEQSREAAQTAVSMANLRQVGMAMHMHAAENSDRLPESIDELMPYLGGDGVLSSPSGPTPDGSPDIAIRTDLGGTIMSRIDDPMRTMAAIDRAAVMNAADTVGVCFFDGHVEQIYTWQLTELLALEQNRGAFEAFSLPDWLNPGF